MARPSDVVRAEIEEALGFVPPFFQPAVEAAPLLENLWQQTRSAYLDNPIPALFKEMLFAYLSRFCSVPYCLVVHSCALRPMGVTAGQILKLLEAPTGEDDDTDEILRALSSISGRVEEWPEGGSTLDRALMGASVEIFLQGSHAGRCLEELRRLLPAVLYGHLVSFLAYVKTCFEWVEAHPELSFHMDRRVAENLGPLHEEEPELARFFATYRDRVQGERRRREERLRAEITDVRSQLAAILENSDDAIIGVSLDRAITVWSGGAERLFGYREEEILGRHVSVLIPLERSRDEQEIMRRILAGDRVEHYETQRVRRDGRVIDVSFTISPILDASGAIVGTSGIGRDITARKLAEQALRQSEERFRLLAENAQDLIYRYRLTPPGFEYVSPSATRITGYTPEEHYADPELGVKLVHPDDLPVLQALVRSGFVTSEPIVLRWRRKDGAWIWTEQRNTPIFDEQGQLVAVEGIARDISERRLTERALAQSEARFRKIFEEGPVGIGLVGRDLRFIDANGALCRIVGYSREELGSMTVLDLADPLDPEPAASMLGRAFTSDGPGASVEFRGTRKGGGSPSGWPLPARPPARRTGSPPTGSPSSRTSPGGKSSRPRWPSRRLRQPPRSPVSRAARARSWSSWRRG